MAANIMQRQIRNVHIQGMCNPCLFCNYSLMRSIRGWIQVGCHTGEEYQHIQPYHIPHQLYFDPHCESLHYFSANVLPKYKNEGESITLVTSPVWSSSCKIKMNCHSNKGNSTALTKLGAEPETIKEMDAVSLDDFFNHFSTPMEKFNALFIDVEGAELEVLRGARNLLRYIDIVCMEVSNVPIFEGQPTMDDFNEILNYHGLYWFDETCEHPENGQSDVVFARINPNTEQTSC